MTEPTLTFKPSKYADFMRRTKIRTPKYKFYVEIGGQEDAPTILLIMGLGAQLLTWPNGFCEALIHAGYRVIRFDNRDVGKSSKLKHKNKLTKSQQKLFRQLILASRFKLGLSNHAIQVPYNLFHMAEDVHQLMQALDIRRCYIIGMSMGGMIAQILAAQYPDKVIALGLLATSNNKPLSPPPYPRKIWRLARTRRKETRNTEASIDYMVEILKSVGSPDHFDEEQVRDNLKLLHQRRYYPKGSLRQLMAVMATGSLVITDKSIRAPTLIVHGRQDRLFLPVHAKNLHQSIAGSKLVMLDGLGHDIPAYFEPIISQLFIDHFNQYPAPNPF